MAFYSEVRMSARIQLHPHMSTEELYACYRSTGDAVERARWQALWMLSKGTGREEVARSMGFSAEWVRRVAARYNESLERVADGRHRNGGHGRLLTPAQFQELERALEGASGDGTPWSGPKVARWMSEKLSRVVAPQRGWDYLRNAGQTPQRPRPRHQEACAEAQASFPACVAESL
jgi:transposase